MYGFFINGNCGVCIGSFDNYTKLDIRNCAIEAKQSTGRGLVVGSLRNGAEITISGISLRTFMSVKEAVVLGTLEGPNADVNISNSNVFMDIHADKCTVFGSFRGDSNISIDQISCMIRAEGNDMLVYGGRGENNDLSISNSDTDLEVFTDLNRLTNAKTDDLKLVSGHMNVILNGEHTDLVGV